MNLGNAIKRRRESAGLSQLELALQMGEGLANPSDISRIENGKQWPTREKIEAIAQVFGCPVSDLFLDDDEEIPANKWERAAHSAHEPVAAYTLEDSPPNLNAALRAVEQELPPVDHRTQALAAAQIYNALISRQNADRIVDAINSLVIAIEQLKDQGG